MFLKPTYTFSLILLLISFQLKSEMLENYLDYGKSKSSEENYSARQLPYLITGSSMRVRFKLNDLYSGERLILTPPISEEKTIKNKTSFTIRDLPRGTIVILNRDTPVYTLPYLTHQKESFGQNIPIVKIVTDPKIYEKYNLKIPKFTSLEYKINNWLSDGLQGFIYHNPKSNVQYIKPLQEKVNFHEIKTLLDETTSLNNIQKRNICENYFPDSYMEYIPSERKIYIALKHEFNKQKRYKDKKITNDEMIDEICGPEYKDPEDGIEEEILYKRFQNAHRKFCKNNIYLFSKIRMRTKINNLFDKDTNEIIKKDYLNFLAMQFTKDEFSKIITALTLFGEERELKDYEPSSVFQLIAEMSAVLKTIDNRKKAAKGYIGGYENLNKQDYLSENDNKGNIVNPTHAGACLSKLQYSTWNRDDKNLLNIIGQNEEAESHITIRSDEFIKLAFRVVKEFEKGTFHFDAKNLARSDALHSHVPVSHDPWKPKRSDFLPDEKYDAKYKAILKQYKNYKKIENPRVKIKSDRHTNILRFRVDEKSVIEIDLSKKTDIIIKDHIFASGVPLS